MVIIIIYRVDTLNNIHPEKTQNMDSLIKVNKDYKLESDLVQQSQSNHREQLYLIITLHLLTGETDKKLIEQYLELVLPLSRNYTKQKYNSITSHRCKKRKELKKLMDKYFIT